MSRQGVFDPLLVYFRLDFKTAYGNEVSKIEILLKTKVVRKTIVIILILLSVNLFAQRNDNSREFNNDNGVNGQNNFIKGLRVGLYGSTLIPSSSSLFQNSYGFSANIIWDHSEDYSLSLNFAYIFKSVFNESLNSKSSYFYEISLNERLYTDVGKLRFYFTPGLNYSSEYNPNDGVYGSVTNLIGLEAGIGAEININKKLSIEANTKMNFGFGIPIRCFLMNIGLDYKIIDYN